MITFTVVEEGCKEVVIGGFSKTTLGIDAKEIPIEQIIQTAKGKINGLIFRYARWHYIQQLFDSSGPHYKMIRKARLQIAFKSANAIGGHVKITLHTSRLSTPADVHLLANYYYVEPIDPYTKVITRPILRPTEDSIFQDKFRREEISLRTQTLKDVLVHTNRIDDKPILTKTQFEITKIYYELISEGIPKPTAEQVVGRLGRLNREGIHGHNTRIINRLRFFFPEQPFNEAREWALYLGELGFLSIPYPSWTAKPKWRA